MVILISSPYVGEEREQGGESDSMGRGGGREGSGEHRKVLWSLALQDE